MNYEELTELIKKGESATVEFKENFDKSAIEAAVAFANTKGGSILIGVSDKGQVRGVQLGKETLKEWANQISQSTEPRVIPEMEPDQSNGRQIAVIRIKEFPLKPVSLKGRCYRRVGSSNRVMSAAEIAELHFHSVGMSWDKLPAGDASMNDIDLTKVRQYVRRANGSGRRKIAKDEKPLQVLKKLELVKNGQPTWAAALLFGKASRHILSQAAIHCGRFKEDIVVIDDRMVEGSLVDQVEEAMDFIRKNTNVRFVMTGQPAREQVWDYPLEALREAVINAVCHRDYTIPSYTELRIYDDRLIVWNPGGLPLGTTLDDLYKLHSSTSRNKGIAGVFYDVALIEQWGSGIDKMRKACVQAGLPEPQLEEYQGFRVIFRKDLYTEEYLRGRGLNKRQIMAIVYVKEKGIITNAEYQKLTGVSRRTASRELQNAVEKDVLQMTGRVGKGAKYVLKTPNAPIAP